MFCISTLTLKVKRITKVLIHLKIHSAYSYLLFVDSYHWQVLPCQLGNCIDYLLHLLIDSIRLLVYLQEVRESSLIFLRSFVVPPFKLFMSICYIT
ncbi:hypothetical protein [Staphylococcus phage phiSa2wa_st93]|uniref:Uncharacterized protein n=1 Tax=Staphylococcus phage phiSa2wa_st93 TaxID=2060956 RepID=A0A2I6PES5_9CAUD|nr:hypothetical protein [Staphylococcus phage phiSa2wa_st93]